MRAFVFLLTALVTLSSLPSRTSATDDNITTTPAQEKWIEKGIPVVPVYAEKRSIFDPPAKIISVPGCPNSEPASLMKTHPFHRDVWVYHGLPLRCFLQGTQGDCPEGMKLGVDSVSTVGVCKCDCFFPSSTSRSLYTEEKPWNPLLNEKRVSCYNLDEKRHYTFVPQTGKCHQLLSQGPCPEDHWLVVDVLNNVVCDKRRCKQDNSTSTLSFYDFESGECKKLGDSCGDEKKTYAITPSHWYPICDNAPPKGTPTEVQPSECQKNKQRFSPSLKKCVGFNYGNGVKLFEKTK